MSLAIHQAPSRDYTTRTVLIRSSIALSPRWSGAAPALAAPSPAPSAMALQAHPAPRRDQYLCCTGGYMSLCMRMLIPCWDLGNTGTGQCQEAAEPEQG